MATIVRFVRDVNWTTEIIDGSISRDVVYEFDKGDIISLSDDTFAADLISKAYAVASAGPVTTTEAAKGIVVHLEQPEASSGGSTTVIDNLLSASAVAALSANQGRLLKDMIDSFGTKIDEGLTVIGVNSLNPLDSVPVTPVEFYVNGVLAEGITNAGTAVIVNATILGYSIRPGVDIVRAVYSA